MNFGEFVYSSLRERTFRGKYRLSNMVVPRCGLRSARVFGYAMQLDLSDYVQRSIYTGLYEPEDTAWMAGVLRTGMTFVDVGANVGYYTALAARMVGPHGRVVAFEPEETTFAKLQQFVVTNGLSHVTCKHVALSDRQAMLKIFVPPKSYGNHNASTSAYCADMTAQEIPAATLDDCLAELKSVDLLKIDVEGHEFEVLRGALRSIRAGRIKTILCELNDKMLGLKGSSARALYEWLLEVGYRDLDGSPDFTIISQNRRFVFA